WLTRGPGRDRRASTPARRFPSATEAPGNRGPGPGGHRGLLAGSEVWVSVATVAPLSIGERQPGNPCLLAVARGVAANPGHPSLCGVCGLPIFGEQLERSTYRSVRLAPAESTRHGRATHGLASLAEHVVRGAGKHLLGADRRLGTDRRVGEVDGQ